MKPQLINIKLDSTHSFSVRQDMIPNINNRWHYHKELELIFLQKGTGTQFVGDSIRQFEAGDVVLVGSNLPHFWRYDDAYFSDLTSSKPYSTVAHLTENFFGNAFNNLPENAELKILFEEAKRGILIPRKESLTLGNLIEETFRTSGLERTIFILRSLKEIINTENKIFLASEGFKYEYSENETDRLNTIYQYTMQNYKETIYLEKVAETINLVPNSFCRYFKSRTGKTYSQFLIEIRITNACKLLTENKMPVKQICFESGFKNFSCFYKNFKKMYGVTPQKYQDVHSNQD
jgi:AraC-like DNA-binding protein